MSTKSVISTLNRELKRWLVASEKFKKTSAIQYAKVKSALNLLETAADKDTLNKLQGQLGLNFISKLIILINDSEKTIEELGENVTESIDDCFQDIDKLKPKHAKKRSHFPLSTTPKRPKKKCAKRLNDETAIPRPFVIEEAEGILYIFFDNDSRFVL